MDTDKDVRTLTVILQTRQCGYKILPRIQSISKCAFNSKVAKQPIEQEQTSTRTKETTHFASNRKQKAHNLQNGVALNQHFRMSFTDPPIDLLLGWMQTIQISRSSEGIHAACLNE